MDITPNLSCPHDGYPKCVLCGAQTQLPDYMRTRHAKTMSEELMEIYHVAARGHESSPVGGLVRAVLDMHLDGSTREFLDAKNAAIDLIRELMKLAQRQHERLVECARDSVPVFIEDRGPKDKG
jgi:hypothetical protein